MSFTKIRMAVGRVVLVVGILVLLLIPYLLWGTGLMTAHSQDVLRQQFRADQHRTGSHPTAPKRTATVTAPQVAPTVADPAPGTAVGVISIPKINLSMVIVEGTDTAQLQQGPGHYPGTPLPGEAGNAAIAGHRTTYLHPFYYLDQLVPGDDITVTTLQGVFEYQMTSQQIVDPTDVSVVDDTTTPQLTLTTCNPRFSASQRMVVHAALIASSLTHPAAPPAVVVAKPKPQVTLATESTGSWPAAIIWGIVVAAIAMLAWMATTRTKGGRRAAVVIVGVLAWLAVVFFFFEAVGPLLGSSF